MSVRVNMGFRQATGRPSRTSHERAILAAIARREWLLQMLALGAAGCARTTDRAYARGNTLIAAVDSLGTASYAPLTPDVYAEYLVYLPLVRINDRGERQPCLAVEWTHSADYLEWTYRIRPGVRWHDGRPVTADDAKFTIDLHARPDSDVYGLRTECTVRDPSTFSVRGIGWTRWEGADSYMSIVPKHLLQGLNYQKWYEWDFWLRPVGNGPYRYVRHQPETMVELEANPDYYQSKPKIDRIVLKITRGAGLTELLSGNVDAISVGIDGAQKLSALARDRRFRTFWSAPNFWHLTVIVWQNEHPLFREPAVRRALSLGINRRELVQVLQLPSSSSRVDGVYTMRQFQRGEMSEPRYDPIEARGLLDEAGWRSRGPDGMRTRGRLEFRFTALTGSGWVERAALYVQDQLRDLGVRMDLQPLEMGHFRSMLRAKSFEAAICPQFFMGTMEGALLERFFGEGSPTGYRNPQLMRLYERLRTTAEPEAVDQAHREISDLLRGDQPLATLFAPAGATVVHRRVNGLSEPWQSDPLRFTDDLWLENRP